MVHSKVVRSPNKNLEKENDINFANRKFREFCEKECSSGSADACVYLKKKVV